MNKKNKKLTESYSTWGSKILQHADVLHTIQNSGFFKPITIQLAPIEACDSDCPFCSVAGRPLKNKMKWPQIVQVLNDFRTLGAKSVEITGGGNPMLWRDGNRNINDIITYAHSIGLEVGIITNSHDIKTIKETTYDKISWLRISLIKLDEGKTPEDYRFYSFPRTKLGFSYIIYDGSKHPDPMSRTGRVYTGTTVKTIEDIVELINLTKGVKFVRLAGNCLIKGNNETIKNDFANVIAAINKQPNFFLKDIGSNDSPFADGCYVGALRPYVASHPQGEGYYVYACTSHVLQKRNYDLSYALCPIERIMVTWHAMQETFREKNYPYEIKNNKGENWDSSCKFCYYHNNNKIVHTVCQPLPDKNFA